MQPGDNVESGQEPQSRRAETTIATPQSAVPLPVSPTPNPYVVQQTPQSQDGFDQFNSSVSQSPINASGEVSWTASEFVAREKSWVWYVLYVFAALVASAAIYFLTKDMVMLVVAVLTSSAFGVVASRRPRVLQYKLDGHGITIGPTQYPYHAFKSYSSTEVGAMEAIDLIPMKRLSPAITIYPPPDQREHIISKIGDNLPFIHRDVDMIERLMHRIHF